MSTFTNALIREIGRNYGKAISNSLLGDAHANPVRIVGTPRFLGAGSGGRNYENKLIKLLKLMKLRERQQRLMWLKTWLTIIWI
ncbi:hypothetical protein OAI15_02130 [Flavobacteriaceae bacterium]|nr:hypothetical protein [Flavobacteriaceae bacterium]